MKKDSILLCPLCENDLKESYFIGKTFDTAGFKNHLKILFF